MKLSTRSRYGIRALLDLAQNYEDKPVSIKNIANRQMISEQYLANIFHDLKKNGILDSTIGKNGGFYLAKPLDEISILEIIDILEGFFNVVHCIEDIQKCKISELCTTRDLWENINRRIRDSLADIKLVDTVKIEQNKYYKF